MRETDLVNIIKKGKVWSIIELIKFIWAAFDDYFDVDDDGTVIKVMPTHTKSYN